METRLAEVIAVDIIQVYCMCPYCGKRHMHGSNGRSNLDDYGSRVPHCFPGVGEYDLKCSEYTIRAEKITKKVLKEAERAWKNRQLIGGR